MDKKLSVIIPACNAEKYVERCIESIVSQGIDDAEILLVDDGSTDNTLHACNALAKKYPCIRVFHKANGGASSARNLGIDNAHGEYLMFADVDDYLLPGALPKAMAVTEAFPDADFYVFGFDRISRSGDTSHNVFPIRKYSRADFLDYIHEYDFLRIGTPCAKLYKRAHIMAHDLRFDNTMISFEDLYFNINVLKQSNCFVTSDVLVYCYEVNGQSATAKFNGDVVMHDSSMLTNAYHDLINSLSGYCKGDIGSKIIAHVQQAVCFHILFEVYNLYRMKKFKGKYAWLKRMMGHMDEVTPQWRSSFRSGFPGIVVRAYCLHPRCADILLRAVFLIKT